MGIHSSSRMGAACVALCVVTLLLASASVQAEGEENGNGTWGPLSGTGAVEAQDQSGRDFATFDHVSKILLGNTLYFNGGDFEYAEYFIPPLAGDQTGTGKASIWGDWGENSAAIMFTLEPLAKL